MHRETLYDTLKPEDELAVALRHMSASEAVARSAKQRWDDWLAAVQWVDMFKANRDMMGLRSRLPRRPPLDVAAACVVAGAQADERKGLLARSCMEGKKEDAKARMDNASSNCQAA